jgi:3-oxoacyl-[acyl-carrier-protein] synthase II
MASASAERVVITGIGAVTPIGHGARGLWRGVQRGQSSVRRLSRFDPSLFRSHLAAEVDDLPTDVPLDAREARRLDRFSHLAVLAARQAVEYAGLRQCDLPATAGCYLGSALGGIAFAEAQHQAFLSQGARGVNPSLALSVFGGAAPSNVAIALGLRGPSVANSNSCASGAIAIGEAFVRIREGQAPLMLAGGAEAPLAPLTFGSFALIKAMSTSNATPEMASRPFDVRRDGFVMGEGSAMLVLESLSHAQRREARVYAEIRGYGTTNDAYHMLAPRPDGLEAARAISLALDDAALEPDAVEYVNAHASSTAVGDRAEAAAIQRALGEHARRVLISGTKGLYGHPLGASGAIETAITALAMCHGCVPGTTNLSEPDPELGIPILGPAGCASRPRVALKNAFGFGGINAALVLVAP